MVFRMYVDSGRGKAEDHDNPLELQQLLDDTVDVSSGIKSSLSGFASTVITYWSRIQVVNFIGPWKHEKPIFFSPNS
jgi:hypothetical protein